MPKTCVEMRGERATLVNEARKTYDAAEAREGGVTDADREAFTRAMDGADKLKVKIDDLERIETAEAEMEAPGERRSQPLDKEVAERRETGRKAEVVEAAQAKIAAYRHWLRTGQVRENLRGEASRAAELRDADGESRDVSIATASQGGYLITPVQISDDIVSQMDNLCFVRELCRASNSITTVTSAQKLGIRQKTARMSLANWTTEVGSLTDDTTMAFGRRDLEPQQLSKLALVSIRTLMLTKDAEKEVNDELAYQFAITEESAFLTGSGSSQPLGVFTPDASGVPTGQDVTSAAPTAISGDDLINVKFSLRQVYLKGPSVAWVMHRTIVQAIRKIKQSSAAGFGDQNYVWQPGLTEGAPDRVLDIPLKMSEYAPSSITATSYTALLGNFRYFRIAELPDIMVQRLVELYAATGQVGFVGRHWIDGAPVLGEAFARLKQHA